MSARPNVCARSSFGCEALGTQYEELQWTGWRRWTGWLLLFAWRDDAERLGLASDCLPEPYEGDRAPSRSDLRAYACAILAQAYGEGHRDELAARWRPAWSWWLNSAASTWSDGLRHATRCADWIYRRKSSLTVPWTGILTNPGPANHPPLDPPLVDRAAAGDELAARVLGWVNDACMRALKEHAHCAEDEEWYGYAPRYHGRRA